MPYARIFWLMKFVAFLIFLLCGIYIFSPLVFNLTGTVTGYGDNFIYVWIHTWIINSITSGNLSSIFTTNIFYPFQIGPASSDPNIITALFSLIPYLITKEPIITINFPTISALVLSGFSIYLLSYKLTKDYLASILSGILIVLSPAYLSFFAHLQVFFIALTPLSLLYFIKFNESQKLKHFLISLIFLLLQIYNNFMAGYFILFSYLIIFFFNYINDKEKSLSLITKKSLFIFISALILAIPVMIPYFKVSKEFGYVRSIKDTVHFAIQPEDLLYTSGFSKLQPILNTLPIHENPQNGEVKPGFLGTVFSILTLICFIYAFKNLKRINVNLNSFLSISLLGLILSLGPVLHLGRQTVHEPFLIPLPYALFYYLVPGFQGFRNTARWEMLFIVGASIVIAIVLSKLLSKINIKKKMLIYSFLIIGCIIEVGFPIIWSPIPKVSEFPPEHKWLNTISKDDVYLEMPIYNWNMSEYATIELWRLYFSTINFRRTVNGGGGFTPEPWQKMTFDLDANFPSNKTISELKKMGVDFVIIHKDQYDLLNKNNFVVNNIKVKNGNEILKEINKNSEAKLIQQFPNVFIYKLN